jgi:uncharacterized Zn-binding protein involved in type VI secretion
MGEWLPVLVLCIKLVVGDPVSELDQMGHPQLTLDTRTNCKLWPVSEMPLELADSTVMVDGVPITVAGCATVSSQWTDAFATVRTSTIWKGADVICKLKGDLCDWVDVTWPVGAMKPQWYLDGCP